MNRPTLRSVFPRPGGARSRGPALVAVALVLSLVLPEGLTAQGGAPAGGSLRPYWHVFAAYAVAWVLLAVWVLRIARRLRDVERSARGGGG